MKKIFILIALGISPLSGNDLSWLQIGGEVLSNDLRAITPLTASDTSTKKPETTPTFTDLDARKEWFRLLHNHTPLVQKTTLHTNISLESIRKLQILSDPSGNSLLNVIPTKTIFGQADTARRLSAPQTDIPKIKSIQNVISFFTTRQDIRVLIERDLDRIKQGQEVLIRAFKERSGSEAQSYLNAYMGITSPHHKSSKTSLLFTRLYNNDIVLTAFRITLNTSLDLCSIWCLNQGTKQKLGKADFDEDDITTIMKAVYQSQRRGYLQVLISNTLIYCLTLVSRWMNKEIVQSQKQYFESLAKEVMSAQELVQRIKNLQKTLATTEALPSKICTIKSAFTNDSPSFKKLMEIFDTTTFHPNTRLPWRQADILVAYALIQEHKEDFVQAFKAIGQLDTYVAVSKLIKPDNSSADQSLTEKNNQPFCLVQLKKSHTPYIALETFRHPLLKNGHTVENNITLGENSPTTVVFSGPNGTGKTVALKAIALNAVLAGLGIAAAGKAVMTPITHLNTYLRIGDNLDKNASTFMAEKTTLQKLVTETQNTSRSTLTIIDEPVKGTVEKTGGNIVAQSIEKMTQNQHLLLTATHFKAPTELAQKNPQQIANVYLDTTHTDRDESDSITFTRTYKIKAGQHPWWFTDEVLREAFVDWLSQQQ